MKKYFWFSVLFLLLLISSCVTSAPFDEEDIGLKKNEGYLVVRIINPGAGKNFYGTSESGERIENFPSIKTNSDISVSCIPFCISPCIIKNDVAPVQIGVMKIKKGRYGISYVGKNSMYTEMKTFFVHPQSVNYLGDLFINYIDGIIATVFSPYTEDKIRRNEFYTLEIEDHSEEIYVALKKMGYYGEGGAFENLPYINICKPTKKILWPALCPMSRPKDLK